MTWKNEGKRHEMAARRIKTKEFNNVENIRNENVNDMLNYMIKLRHLLEFNMEIVGINRIETPEQIGFTDIVNEAIKDKNLTDEQVQRIIYYSEKLYKDYLNEAKKYYYADL